MKFIPNILLFLLLLELTACVNQRSLQYVQGQFDTARLSSYVVKEPVIQKGDLMSIIVFSDNPAATALYNIPNSAGTTAGYQVDIQGNIQFQGLGNLHVEGLNRQQLTDLLNSKLTVFLKNPYYTIRFLNYKITVLGEVNREGPYSIPNEKVNILEAIGLAGGLSIYAKRQNVLVIRESNGKREFARLDLTNPEIFKSPYYFLQQNDMVLVEQSRIKIANYDQTTARNISVATTLVSTLLFIYTVFKK